MHISVVVPAPPPGPGYSRDLCGDMTSQFDNLPAKPLVVGH